MNDLRTEEIVEKCLRIAEQASDSSGRVSVRRLCSDLGVELKFRPLLVEAMLTSQEGKSSRWSVFVDSETHAESLLDDEFGPSSKRLRNTIAHELLHTLGFQIRNSRIDNRKSRRTNQTNAEMLSDIEAETERFSPLLLLPTKAVRTLQESSEASSFAAFCDEFGVSKFALIGRLKLTAFSNEERNFRFLDNIAVGIVSGKTLSEWPLYFRFDRNIAPTFIWRLVDGESVALSSVFTGTSKSVNEVKTQVSCGTHLNRECEIMNIQFTVDSNADRNRIFAVRSIPEGSVEVQDLLKF